MSDETRAAAALLYKATMNTLRRCRGNSNVVRSAEDLAHCATPQLVDVVMSNDSLMHALALHYALQVVVDLPPLAVKPKPAPRDEDWSVNLLEPSEEN